MQQVSPGAGVVQFPVQGTCDPYAAGFYYTRVLMGSPPVEFHVLIDTGSEFSWVNCASCSGCPSLSELPIQLELFNPASSSTQNSTCKYNILYADRSGISGYYVADNIHLDIISENSVTSSTASIVFGFCRIPCTNTDSELSWVNCASCSACPSLSELPIQLELFNRASSSTSSVIQCSDPHCPSNHTTCSAQNTTCNYNILYADRSGISGYYVADNIHLDIIIENSTTSSTISIVFGKNYHVHLEGININGQPMQIHPNIFANQRTVLDSGTYFVYLAQEVFSPLVHVIDQSASTYRSPIPISDK